ncbi:hypothetical protein BBJ28_00014749 [Nothophytophthora sp. Chile5]|nr:hypothetical protein BBJ28_00014749 [Nothophytophthora sp. Chile5]
MKKSRLVEIGSPQHTSSLSHVVLRAFLLLGQCMLAIKQKEECLELLGKVLPEREHEVVALAKKVQFMAEGTEDADGVNVVASLALLMGETFEAVGNRENATVYFRVALRCDVHCAEAFFHLFDKQMLSAQEEKQLVASLDFSADEMQLLELLYQTHVGKYDTTPSVEERFLEVEEEFGLAGNLELVDVYPKKATAWYTVGCYYLLIEKYDAAQRYFQYVVATSRKEQSAANSEMSEWYLLLLVCAVPRSKATTMEASYAPAWIGFGNSFAAQDESDQAMSSYRTASSLFPGSHLPPLYMGMEYLRTNSLVQAQEFIQQASEICPTDPLVYNELGTVHYKQKDYPRAIEMFTKALQLCKGLPEALAYAPEDTLAGAMITVAFEESLSAGPESIAEFAEPPRGAPKTSGLTPMSAALSARRLVGLKGSEQQSRRLDQSFSSIELSRQSLACSSLDFSDDSSMNVDE